MNATHAGSVSVSRESSSSLPDIAVLAMDGRIDPVVKECLRQILERSPVESQGIRPDKAADEHCLYQDQWVVGETFREPDYKCRGEPF